MAELSKDCSSTILLQEKFIPVKTDYFYFCFSQRGVVIFSKKVLKVALANL